MRKTAIIANIETKPETEDLATDPDTMLADSAEGVGVLMGFDLTGEAA